MCAGADDPTTYLEANIGDSTTDCSENDRDPIGGHTQKKCVESALELPEFPLCFGRARRKNTCKETDETGEKEDGDKEFMYGPCGAISWDYVDYEMRGGLGERAQKRLSFCAHGVVPGMRPSTSR